MASCATGKWAKKNWSVPKFWGLSDRPKKKTTLGSVFFCCSNLTMITFHWFAISHLVNILRFKILMPLWNPCVVLFILWALALIACANWTSGTMVTLSMNTRYSLKRWKAVRTILQSFRATGICEGFLGATMCLLISLPVSENLSSSDECRLHTWQVPKM